MEFPILQHLPLPGPAIRMVTEFLREPHPTAAMIKALRFSRWSGGFSVKGKTIRYHKMGAYPPKFMRDRLTTVSVMRIFNFDEETGEFEIESDYDDGMTVEDLRLLGMSDAELVNMGYTLTD